MWAIVVAAGRGSRYGQAMPKQFSVVAGRRVIDWSVAAASAVSEGIVVVLPAEHHPEIATTLDAFGSRDCAVIAVPGGSTRSASVRAGLDAVPSAASIILVHDAARPAAGAAIFGRVIDAVRAGASAVVPVADVVDTMRHSDGIVVDRDKLQVVQTPQGFEAAALRNGHASGIEATDDATVVEQAGGQVMMVEGDRWNIKLTTPDDALVLDALLSNRAPHA